MKKTQTEPDIALDKALLRMEIRADRLGHESLSQLLTFARTAFECGLTEELWGLLKGLKSAMTAYGVQKELFWPDTGYPELEHIQLVRPDDIQEVRLAERLALGRMEFGEASYVLYVEGTIRGLKVRSDLSPSKKTAARRARGKGVA